MANADQELWARKSVSRARRAQRRAHCLARRARVWPRWCAGGRLEQRAEAGGHRRPSPCTCHGASRAPLPSAFGNFCVFVLPSSARTWLGQRNQINHRPAYSRRAEPVPHLCSRLLQLSDLRFSVASSTPFARRTDMGGHRNHDDHHTQGPTRFPSYFLVPSCLSPYSIYAPTPSIFCA